MDMPQKLAGKVAVITGGSSGIGLATAKRFVDEGAYVFITGRRQSELEAAVSQIGQNVTGIQGDVSKVADLDKLYAAVKEKKGKVDIVFANAGTGAFAALGQISEEHFDKQFDVKREGTPVYSPEGAPAAATGRIDRSQRIDSLHHRQSGLQRLQRDQSCSALVCAHLVRRPQGTQDPGKCN
jgi:NAD(P)-dependent dehydrogenase (short-subunit alcohol dehydrogenase family)